MLATAGICDGKWLGQRVQQGRAIYFPVEDDERELRRRQAAIADYYGIRFADFPGRFKIIPMAGKDTVLAAFDSRSGLVKPTPLYGAVRKIIEEFKPALTIVGNRVNIFSERGRAGAAMYPITVRNRSRLRNHRDHARARQRCWHGKQHRHLRLRAEDNSP
jgi:RecA-family ATPase